MNNLRLIKKYANRRLYDTEASAHITLDGIHGLIVSGHEVKIVDDTSGEDITRSVLLQIMAELEQGGSPMLDTTLLTHLIRLYGNPMQHLAGEYLLKSFKAFMSQQNQFQEQMRAALATTPLATMQELTASSMKAWTAMQEAVARKHKGNKDETE